MRIDGKIALITGAGSGIGRALAVEAARRGARVVLTGRRPDALKQTAALLGGNAAYSIVPGDITQPSTRILLRDHLEDFGRLDFLVNNAGVISAGPLAAGADADIERLMMTNLVAPIALTREMLPLLAAAAPSRIVNVGSILGDIGYPLFAAYSASKFGLRGFSMALRRELKGLGIGVTYAAPRATETGAASAFRFLVLPLGMRLDCAASVAGDIWGAAARNADTAYPAGSERLYILLQRLLPGVIDRALAGQLKHPAIRGILAKAMPWADRLGRGVIGPPRRHRDNRSDGTGPSPGVIH
jgi:short-subunit dehydrogenase